MNGITNRRELTLEAESVAAAAQREETQRHEQEMRQRHEMEMAGGRVAQEEAQAAQLSFELGYMQL